MQRMIATVAAAMLLAGCGSAAGEARPPVAAASSTVASPSLEASRPAVATTSAAPSLVTLSTTPPGSCAVTKPTPEFIAPPPAPREPPAYYRSAWYGARELWTMLNRDGEGWWNLPRDLGGFGQKTFWWSTRWDHATELEPAISVGGRRLDGPGAFDATGLGTNAVADFGVAMLIGVEIPAAGCWRLTGTYRGASLTYIVWVAG